MEETAKQTEDWEAYVRSEVVGALDTFLPYSDSGNIGVSYKKLVKEQLESGPVYDQNQVVGVKLVIDLQFKQPEKIPT